MLAGNAQPCASKDAGGNLVYGGYDASGWCPMVSDTLADGTIAEYRIGPETAVVGSNPPAVTRKVVATGRHSESRRRVYTEIHARQGAVGFGIYGISAKDRVFFQNEAEAGTLTNPVDVRSNGEIEMKDGSFICGNVTPGPGQAATGAAGRVCPGKSTAPATTLLDFPNYDAEHNAAWTTNDNARLGCSGTPPKDACTNSGTVFWGANRQLTIDNSSSLTLGGNVYSLCRLHLKNNSRFIIAPRPAGAPPLKLYIADPSRCPGVPGEQIMVENGVGITNQNTDPVTLQIFVHGNTIVDYKNTSTVAPATPMMLYAPNATVLLQNSAKITGGLAGKIVELKNDVRFNYDPNAATPVGTPAWVYRPTQHRECSPQARGAAPAPDTGC